MHVNAALLYNHGLGFIHDFLCGTSRHITNSLINETYWIYDFSLILIEIGYISL
jgi:hypothetical protein